MEHTLMNDELGIDLNEGLEVDVVNVDATDEELSDIAKFIPYLDKIINNYPEYPLGDYYDFMRYVKTKPKTIALKRDTLLAATILLLDNGHARNAKAVKAYNKSGSILGSQRNETIEEVFMKAFVSNNPRINTESYLSSFTDNFKAATYETEEGTLFPLRGRSTKQIPFNFDLLD